MLSSPGLWRKWGLVIIQVLLWIVFFLLLLLYTSHKWDHPVFGLLNASISTASYILATYGNAAWLIPIYLKKEKKLQYLFASLIFLSVLILGRMITEKMLLLPLHQKFYAFQWSHLSFTCITVLLAFLFGYLLFVFRSYLQLQEIRKELQSSQSEAELNLLKAQVQPHFLFNSLNNIYSLSQSGSPKTPEMIARLSGMMRFFVDETTKQKISLDKELAFVHHYIELEQIRMVHPVQINWQVEDGLKEIMIPPILLIPFIENVFKHGVDKLSRANKVDVSLKEAEGLLVFEVINTTPSGESGWETGTGLSNLRRRLELIYPGCYTLQTEKENGSFRALLKIPLS